MNVFLVTCRSRNHPGPYQLPTEDRSNDRAFCSYASAKLAVDLDIEEEQSRLAAECDIVGPAVVVFKGLDHTRPLYQTWYVYDSEWVIQELEVRK